MKKTLAVVLAILTLLAVLSGCGSGKTETPQPAAGTENENPAADTGTGDPAAEQGAAVEEAPLPEETPDPGTATLLLGKEELQIRIADLHLDDEGKLLISIEGVTLQNSWRDLMVDVVLDGQSYYLETSQVAKNSFTRTSARIFEKLPEQVILYERDHAENALVYDVESGCFVN
jgi:hypothetical protein